MDKIYAAESYSKSGGYIRHDIGSLEDMTNLVKEELEKSVKSGETDSYYRVVEVSPSDVTIWKKQEEMLPSILNTERLFGDWVDIGTAAKYLGVTFGRVFNLTTDGELRNTVCGRNKLVSVEDVVNRKISNPKSGRPPQKK